MPDSFKKAMTLGHTLRCLFYKVRKQTQLIENFFQILLSIKFNIYNAFKFFVICTSIQSTLISKILKHEHKQRNC